MHTGSTVSCHSRNIPQAPRCRCWHVHVGRDLPMLARSCGQAGSLGWEWGSVAPTRHLVLITHGSLPREGDCTWVSTGPEMLWGGPMGLLTRPALMRRAGLLSWRGRKLPCDHAPKMSAGHLATGSSRQTLITARMKGKLAQPSLRAPSHPVVYGESPCSAYFCCQLCSHASLCSLIH